MNAFYDIYCDPRDRCRYAPYTCLCGTHPEAGWKLRNNQVCYSVSCPRCGRRFYLEKKGRTDSFNLEKDVILVWNDEAVPDVSGYIGRYV